MRHAAHDGAEALGQRGVVVPGAIPITNRRSRKASSSTARDKTGGHGPNTPETAARITGEAGGDGAGTSVEETGGGARARARAIVRAGCRPPMQAAQALHLRPMNGGGGGGMGVGEVTLN